MRRILPLLLASLFAACGGPRPPAPAELALGVDACEYCHMTIDDPARAAQWVEPDGTVHTFDEPGCLVAWLQDHPDAEGVGFVADLDTGAWVPLTEATFVHGGVSTAMRFDLVAFRDPVAATLRAADTGGETMDWDRVRAEGVEDVHAH